jgi:hypothetical protein
MNYYLAKNEYYSTGEIKKYIIEADSMNAAHLIWSKYRELYKNVSRVNYRTLHISKVKGIVYYEHNNKLKSKRI